MEVVVVVPTTTQSAPTTMQKIVIVVPPTTTIRITLERNRRDIKEGYVVRYVAWMPNSLEVPDTEAGKMSIVGGPTQAPQTKLRSVVRPSFDE